MARMTGFVFQDEYLARLAKLSDQEVGRLVRALAEYHANGNEPELAGRESVAFDFIKVDIDKADAAYQAKCNNMKRGEPQKTDDCNCEQLHPIASNCDQLTPNININKTKKEKKDINDNAKALSRSTAKESDRLFDKFWSVYPRHEGKENARKAFVKLKPDDAMLETLINAILKQKQSDQWADPKYIPHPATWLNGHRWEDEPVKASKGGKRVLAQQYEQREYNEAEMQKTLGVDDLYISDEEYFKRYGVHSPYV